MTETNVFRRQHAGLLTMGTEIVMAMQGPVSSESVRKVRTLVARFKGALLVHQRMENDALYPSLFAHKDPAVAKAAHALYSDLSDLYDGFLEFEKRYAAPEIAENTPVEYYKSIGRLLKRLMVRMQREDTELYALVLRVDNPFAVPQAPAADPESMRVDEERDRWAKLLNSSRPPA